jgi:hypothetical protein
MSEREDAVLERCAKAVHISCLGARRLLEELRPGDPLPGGLVVVPEEPSEAQLKVAAYWIGGDEALYRAMIRAASEEKP